MKLLLFLFVVVVSSSDLIVDLYNQFKPAMALSDSLTLDEWNKNLPVDGEKDEMFRLIDMIYSMDTFDRLNSSLVDLGFPMLSKSLQLTIIEGRFCVIHEPLKPDPGYKFPRFFGFVVIRSESNTTNRIHHSAAHFETDGPVCLQAANMFSVTHSKSLVVAGASRWAVKGKIPSSCQPKYEIADAAHNSNLMFHIANVAIWESAKSRSLKDDKSEGYFIQWHGMANTSCPSSHVFISIGAPGNHKAYSDENLYANKLKSAINQITGSEFAQTPKSDTNCSLRATTNVYGRIVNGLHFGTECGAIAIAEKIYGNFIHIEQKWESIRNLTIWKDAFDKLSEPKSNGIRFGASFVLIFMSLFLSSL